MLPDERTDGELIRASESEPRLFEAVFLRHYDQVFRYLVRRTGRDVGSDLASEVFAVAFAVRHKFWPEATSAAPWLFGIAANLARRHARSAERKTRAYLRLTPPDSDPGVVDGLEDRVDAQRHAHSLNRALGKLRQKDREVLLLFALGELSYGEIAEALGIPVGTVRSSLSRTRRRLRTDLDELFWSPEGPIGKEGV